MKALMFYIPLFVYEINEWDRKKQALLEKIENDKLGYHQLAEFKSDRNFKKK